MSLLGFLRPGRSSADGPGAEPPLAAPDAADRQVFLIAYLVLLPLYLLPLGLTPLLPGVELPFHLSLGDLLLREGQDGDPYAPIYDARLRLGPHLLHPLWLRLLGPALGLLAAHKLLMALCVGALPLGLARLLSSCRRSRLPALLGFPLFYGMPFFYGLPGFLLSLPLLLLLLGQVTDNIDDAFELEEEERLLPAFLRDGLLVLLAVLLFLCQLETYLFGLLATLLILLFGEGSMVHRVRAGLCFLPSLAGLAWWRVVTLHDGAPGAALREALALVARQRMADLGGPPGTDAILRDVLARSSAFPQQVLLGPPGEAHLLGLAVLGGALGAYVLLGTLCVFLRGGDREPARLVWPGLALLLLAALFYLALPQHLGQLGVTMLAPRFAVVCALLLVLWVPAWLKRAPRLWLGLFALPAAAACAFHGVQLCRGFLRFGEETADFRALMARAPEGRRALGLVFDRQARSLPVGSALVALPHYYPMLRGGAGSMMAQPLCERPHMPCRLRDASLTPPDPGPFAPQRLDVERALGYFDLFITRAAPPALLGGKVVLLGEEGSWALYGKALERPGEPAPRVAERPKEEPPAKEPQKGRRRQRK